MFIVSVAFSKDCQLNIYHGKVQCTNFYSKILRTRWQKLVNIFVHFLIFKVKLSSKKCLAYDWYSSLQHFSNKIFETRYVLMKFCHFQTSYCPFNLENRPFVSTPVAIHLFLCYPQVIYCSRSVDLLDTLCSVSL